MIRVVVLGSGAAIPGPERGLTAIALKFGGSVYLFDCGEGTQRQMMIHGVSYAKVAAIFVSHSHADHILGIAGLAHTLNLLRRTEPLPIYCPRGAKRHIDALLSIGEYGYRIPVTEVDAGSVMDGNGFRVSAFRVCHSRPSLGYLFTEADRRNFDEKKARALGVKGKLFGELERSGSAVVNGKKISYASVSKLKKGSSVAFAGDSMPCESTVAAAKGAALLIHEATYASDKEADAALHKHSTAAQAASVAKKAKVKQLVLTHVSNRYTDLSTHLSEAKKVFRKTSVATDGAAFDV